MNYSILIRCTLDNWLLTFVLQPGGSSGSDNYNKRCCVISVGVSVRGELWGLFGIRRWEMWPCELLYPGTRWHKAESSSTVSGGQGPTATVSLGECTFIVSVLLQKNIWDWIINLCSAVARFVRSDVSSQSVGPLKIEPLRFPQNVDIQLNKLWRATYQMSNVFILPWVPHCVVYTLRGSYWSPSTQLFIMF
jgi:hypothetical protein